MPYISKVDTGLKPQDQSVVDTGLSVRVYYVLDIGCYVEPWPKLEPVVKFNDHLIALALELSTEMTVAYLAKKRNNLVLSFAFIVC